MSISDEITRLTNAKAAIKQSIENKGVDVSDTALLDEYPTLIDKIEGGGEGGGSGYENPDFYELLTNGGTNYNSLFANKTINDTSFIESLNTSKVTNMESTFEQFYSSSNLDLTGWNTSKVTNMVDMFYYTNVPELDVTEWDISNITNIATIFKNARIKILTGLNTWDTSKITNMQETFSECINLTSLDISNWNVSNVTNMERTFYSVNLEILDLSGWNTSNVETFTGVYSCFQGGYSGGQNLTAIIGEIDLSSCTSGMIYSTSYYCFSKLPKLESVYLKNIYKNVTMTNVVKWGINLKDTKVKDECLVYIINELPDLINDKKLTATDKIVFTLPPTNTLTAEQVQVARDKGWQVANTTY